MRPPLLLLSLALMLPAFAYAMARRPESAASVPPLPDLPPVPEFNAPDRLAEPSFLQSIGISDVTQTRGERNNNPGNIVKSGASWQGKVAGLDTRFESFVDPLSGIRAMAKLLKNYQAVSGLKTTRQVIDRYAPPSENNTGSYVSAVAAAVGVHPDDPIDLSNSGVLASFVAAVIKHENGRNIYSASLISDAVRLA